MEHFYNELTFNISRLVTRKYSTSFSIAVSFLNKDIRGAIYSIYGFVRFADEIVDSFHTFNKKRLLEKFERDYYEALKDGISMNPVLNSFQITVRKYNIPDYLVQEFLRSMKYDLEVKEYKTTDEMERYVYGSAEVVGLMCLKVFLEGDEKLFNALQQPARKLGSAFQKVNFLRDIKTDICLLGRRYFPETAGTDLNEAIKESIINDIRNDFNESYPGIKDLPKNARFGVLIAYLYYRNLLKRISKVPAGELINRRVRVPDYKKYIILIEAIFKNKFNLL